MSSMPASAITSASPSFWQVMPFAPALICMLAIIGLLWVLICGRLASPAASQAAWIRAMLRSTRSMSMTAAGVPYSRAILAARGVVMLYLSVRPVGWVERSEPHHLTWSSLVTDIAALHPSHGLYYGLCLLNFFAQHFQLQPPVFGG